ncbi:MAG: glutamate-5-semialdehyde dehydrogenase, partial [Chitinivibrionales bacterium]|nr:glutamate-5-semialdehyde dehydrogenase [Chitinivibrionales bacterium]
ARLLQNVSAENINQALLSMAGLLKANRPQIERENRRDIAAAARRGLSEAMIDRLTLSEKAISGMIEGLQTVSKLVTPLGKVFDARTRPNGLSIYKVRVPIGVIGIVYESRPNVTVDAAAICLKSHNAVILRGGSEAFNSNKILARLFALACAQAGVPEKAVQIVPTTDRAAILQLLKKQSEIDLIIPRGGEQLITVVVNNSRIPVIKHYKGVCHVFVSRNADLQKALSIVVNAKVQRPGVCNAMETLLLDKNLAAGRGRDCLRVLVDNGVILFGDPASRKLLPGIKKATAADWEAEYLDLRCAVRVVDGVAGAIKHINTFGSHHTDAIVTESAEEADEFLQGVDSASVMLNASTRFSDGAQYGMGCEIGISTDKLHARGPMGVDDLTTYKWIVKGDGQIRE